MPASLVIPVSKLLIKGKNEMKKLTRNEPIEAELERNRYQLELKNYSYRKAWVETITNHGPYVCLLTLQFQRSYPDSIAIATTNQFFYNLNRMYFGRRWFRKKWGFSGIIVAEQTKKHAVTAGDLHFHCLLHENEHLKDIVSEYDLYPLRDQAVISARKLKDRKGRYMCSSHGGIDVRAVFDQEGIAAYLTKEIDDRVSESGDQIYTLNYKGLRTGCLEQGRKRAC